MIPETQKNLVSSYRTVLFYSQTRLTSCKQT